MKRQLVYGFLLYGALFTITLNGELIASDIITFGSGENSISMEFVKVGAPGNRPDTDPRIEHPTGPNGSGAVDYEYSIGKFEVSCGQMGIAAVAGAFGDFPIYLALQRFSAEIQKGRGGLP